MLKRNQLMALKNAHPMTLRDAVDKRLVRVIKRERYNADSNRMITYKLAYEVTNPDELWDVSIYTLCTCLQCGARVDKLRDSYAHPTCYDCLPPPIQP